MVRSGTSLMNQASTKMTTAAGTVPPAERYSYSFDGNAQVLDHELITQNLMPRFDARTNSTRYRASGKRPSSSSILAATSESRSQSKPRSAARDVRRATSPSSSARV